MPKDKEFTWKGADKNESSKGKKDKDYTDPELKYAYGN